MLDERLGILRVTMKPLLNTTLLFLLVIGFSGAVSGQDFEETKRLAEQGDATAQFFLGLMYDEGEGVPENDAEAVKWYRLAAEQGDATAQTNLGVMYAIGAGSVSYTHLTLPTKRIV